MAQGYAFTSGSPILGGSESYNSGTRGVASERHYKGGKMKNWIIDQVNSRQFPGLDWVDKEQSKFKVPWRHAKKKGYNRERDAALFKEWALYTGKYAKHSDPTIWKINFRCALNSLKDIKECKEEHTETFKVYQILPFPHNRKRIQKKEVPRTVSKHESLASINFGRQPIMPPHPYNSRIDYSSKFQPIPDLESQLREIEITNIKSQPPSNLSAEDSPFSDLMDRPSPYYSLGNHSHDGLYSDVPEIVISHPPDIIDPTVMLESNLSSNISEPSMTSSYPVGSNMSADQSLAELYYQNLNHNPESLLELPQGFMHLPVSRSKSMDELNSQLGFSNFDANLYKWRSTGSLGNTPWEMYYPASGASSMSSLAAEDFARYFKSEYPLSDSGESNSEYHSANNSYPSSNITLPPCPPQIPVEMPLPMQSSISVESESDNLYIDVANDSKFAQEADYNFSTY